MIFTLFILLIILLLLHILLRIQKKEHFNQELCGKNVTCNNINWFNVNNGTITSCEKNDMFGNPFHTNTLTLNIAKLYFNAKNITIDSEQNVTIKIPINKKYTIDNKQYRVNCPPVFDIDKIFLKSNDSIYMNFNGNKIYIINDGTNIAQIILDNIKFSENYTLLIQFKCKDLISLNYIYQAIKNNIDIQLNKEITIEKPSIDYRTLLPQVLVKEYNLEQSVS